MDLNKSNLSREVLLSLLLDEDLRGHVGNEVVDERLDQEDYVLKRATSHRKIFDQSKITKSYKPRR